MNEKKWKSEPTHVLVLASGKDTHTIRWVNALCEKGLKITLASLHGYSESITECVSKIKLSQTPPFGYYTARRDIQNFIKDSNVHIVHAHYATGYGTLGRLLKVHPFVLSVWGSDVLIFPYKSIFHRLLLQKNIRAADVICSTSKVMAKTLKTLQPGVTPWITPFGIDTKKFFPRQKKRQSKKLVIGTVKKLTPTYGIDRLIKGFSKCMKILKNEGNELSSNLVLQIVGDGPERKNLEQLSFSLGIAQHINFIGVVPHSDVCNELQAFDIYVAVSRSESFGVAILEASACGLPVVVTNVGGLPEVVQHEKTGLLVSNDENKVVNDLAESLVLLLKSKEYRLQLGGAGRRFVQSTYEWSCSVNRMQEIYASVTSENRQSNW